MHCLEVINWMNSEKNCRNQQPRRELNLYPGKPVSNNGHNPVLESLLPTGKHQLLSLKELMNTVLKEANSLPPDVKQTVVTARNAAWKAFVAAQKK